MSNVMTLPLDPTGKATTNDITGEPQAIGTTPVRAFATNYGAFFASSLSVIDAATGHALTSSQYFTAIVFDLPTAKYGLPNNDTIVGMVVVTDPTVSANVTISYQALGGGYQTSLAGLATNLLSYEPATRPANWPNVADTLASTPASQALHDAGQAGLITFEYVVHALDRMTQMALMGDPIVQASVRTYADGAEGGAIGLLNAQIALLNAHIANTNNPHQTTFAQLGAYSEAQQDAAILVETGNRQTADAVLNATLTAHETNYNNPHQVTLTQLGMYSSAQVNTNITAAQTGINTTITTNVAVMNAHINNLNNPHADSTTSLGTLTVAQIQGAITNATTPVSSSATSSQTTLNAHIANYNNPHVVTPAQIGTWTAAALLNLYNSLAIHMSNTANPHNVNISQIGGMTAAQFNATFAATTNAYQGYYNSNYGAVVGHMNNGNNPHQVSAQAIGALGPWNLGQLEADLNNAQASINNSGHPVTEAGTGYFGQSYSGSEGWNVCGVIRGNFERDLVIYQSAGDPVITGGCNTYAGSFPFLGVNGGATVIGFYRKNNVITIICSNGSLDGMGFTSSWGDNVGLSNNWSYSWRQDGGTLYTAYGANSGVGQISGSRAGYVNFSGSPSRGQPPLGYINGAAPPPPTGGGGGQQCHCVCCFIAGNLVLMADGMWKAIETVQAGDWVMGPDGAQRVERLHISRLGANRRLMSFAEDSELRWSEEHSFWAKQEDKQWWWSANPEMWRAEVALGAVKGLKDINSHLVGDVQYAHLDGFTDRTLEHVAADRDTLVYLPITSGSPIIVNGYVVGASLNEFGYDYSQFDWREHQPKLVKHGETLKETLAVTQ
jgi:hypothetical protein